MFPQTWLWALIRPSAFAPAGCRLRGPKPHKLELHPPLWLIEVTMESRHRQLSLPGSGSALWQTYLWFKQIREICKVLEAVLHWFDKRNHKTLQRRCWECLKADWGKQMASVSGIQPKEQVLVMWPLVTRVIWLLLACRWKERGPVFSCSIV